MEDPHTLPVLSAGNEMPAGYIHFSPEAMELFFTLSADLFCIVSLEGVLIKLNPAWEETLGYSLEEFKSMPFIELVHPDDIQTTKQIFAGALHGVDVIDFVNRYRCKDGSYKWLEWRGKVNADGKTLNAVARDITQQKKAEEALRESERLYQSMFRSHSVVKLLIDPTSGYIIDANNAAAKFYGYSRSRLKSMHLGEINTQSIDEIKSALSIAVNRKSNVFSLTHRLSSGEVRDVEIYSSPIAIGDQKLLFSIIHDVTDRKTAEKAYKEIEIRFRRAFELPITGLAITTTNKGWLEVNNAFLELLGYTRMELENLTWADLTHSDDLYKDEKQFERVMSGEIDSYTIEKRFVRKNGETLWAMISAGCVRKLNGSVDYFVALLQDISGRVIAEAELTRLNTELEARVSERTTDLQLLIKDLEKFSYTASHDLRTPLRALNGYSSLLIQDYSEVLDSEGIRMLNIIAEKANLMSDLIDDLVSYNQPIGSKIKPEWIDMKSMAESVYSELARKLHQKHGEFVIQDIPEIYAETDSIREVWTNLIGNAIKFSSRQPISKIEIGGKKEGTEVIYYVKDNGVGFDMLHVNQLFGVFKKLPSTRDFSGTGIGLAIVKRIIDQHNGRVWAEGEKGAGAVFYFSLPQFQ